MRSVSFVETRIRSLETARECAMLGACPRTIGWITGLGTNLIRSNVFDRSHRAPRGRPPYCEDLVFRKPYKVQAELGGFAAEYEALAATGQPRAHALVAAYQHYLSATATPTFGFDEAFFVVANLDGIWACTTSTLELVRCPRCEARRLLARGDRQTRACAFCKTAEGGALPRTPKIAGRTPSCAASIGVSPRVDSQLEALRRQREVESIATHPPIVAEASLSPAPARPATTRPSSIPDRERSMTESLTPEHRVLSQFAKVLVPGSIKPAMRSAGANSSDLYKVPIEQLQVMPGFNARVHTPELAAYVRSLADSIRSEGFYLDSPLAGYVAHEGGGREVIYVTDGHCRLEAARIAIAEGADIAALPTIVSAKGTAIEDLTVRLLRKNAGKPLTPLEQGIVCKRLANFGWDTATIARRTGMGATKIDELLLLMAAPADVREMVRNDQVKAKEAIHQLKTSGADALAALHAMQEVAKAKGHASVTARDRPGRTAQAAAQKNAPSMIDVLRAIRNDPGFAALSEGIRCRVEQLVGVAASPASKRSRVDDARPARSRAIASLTSAEGMTRQ
jgi:hypothetical protein